MALALGMAFSPLSSTYGQMLGRGINIKLALVEHPNRIYKELTKSIPERIEEATNYRVRIEVISLQPHIAIKEIKNGKVDLAVLPGDALPVLDLATIPGTFESLIEYYYIFYKQLNTQFEDAISPLGLKYVAGGACPSLESLFSMTPLATWENFEGKKIATWDSTEAEIVKSLGAFPVKIPASGVKLAFKKGDIDGAVGSGLYGCIPGVSFASAWPFRRVLPWSIVSNSKFWTRKIREDIRIDLQRELNLIATESLEEGVKEELNIPERLRISCALAEPVPKKVINYVKSPTQLAKYSDQWILRTVQSGVPEDKALGVLQAGAPINFRLLQHLQPSHLIWNAWAEKQDSRPYHPATLLQPDTEYNILIDLAPISYSLTEEEIHYQVSKDRFWEATVKWLDKTTNMKQTLRILLLEDPAYFESPAKRFQGFEVRLDRMRDFRDAKIEIPEDPLKYLQKKLDADFVFGHANFKIRTKAKLPSGRASIALVIWIDRRPIEEISFAFCVEDRPCKKVTSTTFGLGGIDSLRVSSQSGRTIPPDAALHFIEFDESDTVLGVYNRAASNHEEPKVWPLNLDASNLVSKINTITDRLYSAQSRTAQIRAGSALFNHLFPNTSDAAQKGREAFRTFAKEQMRKYSPFENDDPPSIFVRLVIGDLQPPVLLPLGMVALDYDIDRWDFLGSYFRIETPLINQTYEVRRGCLANWVMVGPCSRIEDAQKKARTALGPRIDAKEMGGESVFKVGGKTLPIIDNMNDFADWIGDEREPLQYPILLSVLSHHDKDMVYFDTQNPVYSGNIMRRFNYPSGAILNGCGTGKPGASDFIRQLNLRGVESVIATITEVKGTMAGHFLDCFAKQFEEKDGAELSIAEGYRRSLRCLNSQYGAKALWYVLLGNGSLNVCQPKEIP